MSLPLPRWTGAEVVVAPPTSGSGTWAGAPSAWRSGDDIYLAYRLRRPIGEGRGFVNIVARSADGVHFTTVAEVSKRTGVANGTFDRLVARDHSPIGSPYAPHGLRYLTVVTQSDGRRRIYYEATREDGAHDLRTEVF